MKPPKARAPQDGERGSAVIEAVIGVPAFMLFVALIIFAGRTAIAHQAVQSAAASAARSASIARTQQAGADAQSAGVASLTNQNVHCVTKTITVDTAGFAMPVGTPASVTATITCVIDLADLAIPGIPGTHTVTASMTSPLDTYRER